MKPIALTPYEGKEPYIFVSYAHKDSDVVYPILEELNRRGYRVWYDEGIAPGNEWPEEIAQHLDGCYLAISMISERYIASDNCRRELTFALSKRKAFLAVFLEPTELSLGLEMQLSAQLCVLKYNYPSEEAFFRKLCSSKDMAVCCADNSDQLFLDDGEVLSVQDQFLATSRNTVKTSISEKPPKQNKSWVGIAAVAVALLSFAVAMLVPRIMNNGGQREGRQDEEIEYLIGDESSLQFTYETEGETEVASITGVWGNQMNDLGNFVIPDTLSGYPVTKIEQYAFNARTGLKSIIIPDTVTIIEQFAFNGCIDLEKITLSNNIMEISDSLFHGCSALNTINLPKSVILIGENAFYGSGVQSVVVPDSVCSIGANAFAECVELKQIVFSDSVYSIGSYAFFNCTALKNVVLPTSLSAIDYRTFYGCTQLEMIRIPRSVTSIGAEAFYGCDNLKVIYYGGTEAEWKKLMSDIDFNYPQNIPSLNNMALAQATVYYNS